MALKIDEIKLFYTLYQYKDDIDKRMNAIVTYSEMNHNRLFYILDKWVSKGIWDYGVSLRAGWFTPEALEIMTKNKIV